MSEAIEASRRPAPELDEICHDLLGPIAAVDASAELLADGICGELNREQREQVESILRSATRMVELVERLRADRIGTAA